MTVRPKLSSIIETCLYVDNLEVAERFYVDLLGFTLHTKQVGRHTFLRTKEQMLLLFNAETTSQDKHTPHGARGAGHIAFSAQTLSELNSWREYLLVNKVSIEHEIAWPQGGHSIYFRDPAGNSLEFITPVSWGF